MNLNCETAPYDKNALNVYVVDKDIRGDLFWAHRNIVVPSEIPYVIVFGEEFEDFFRQAWRPILERPEGISSPIFLEGFSDFALELYSFYLEYVTAHELAHIKLDHPALGTGLSIEEMQRIELAADMHAARILRSNYFQMTPQLVGLLLEWMKYQFKSTYGRAWTVDDQPPFERKEGKEEFKFSSWQVDVEFPEESHPPFILRTLSMLEAYSLVALDENPRDSRAASIKDLVANVRERIRLVPQKNQ